MITAVVYTSNTGHTREYAELLGQRTGLPVLELKAAKKKLDRGTGILYLGWLMAGKIMGYAEAAKAFRVEAVCGVGMGSGDSQLADMVKTNRLSEGLPLFYLQGGFEMEKLVGIFKLMMQVMKKTAGKGLETKADRSPEEDEMLDLLLNGGNRVSAENLSSVLDWLNKAGISVREENNGI